MAPGKSMHAHLKETENAKRGDGFSRKKPKPARVWDPTRAISVALTKLSKKGRQEASATAHIRYVLQEIAQCILELPFSGQREKAFRCIVETCMLYPKPHNMLMQFRNSLFTARRVAETVKAGRSYPIAPGKEHEAAEFMRKLRRFTSLQGLESIRRMALNGVSGAFNNCQIEFVSWEDVEKICELRVGLSL